MLSKKNPNEKVLGPVRPNVGLEAVYRKKLLALIDRMHKSIEYWVTASFRANEPEMALDASPANELQASIRRLVRQWQKQFNEAAPALARYFAKASNRRTDRALKEILKKAGISAEFAMTPAARDILAATINASVGLIKSIPQQYLHKVEGMVMRAVQTGRDAGTLAKDLRKEFKLTRKRAALIARDQNNKATAAITRARQTELNITEAIWVHSGGGAHPRKTHVANSGKRYKVKDGWYDPAAKKYIFPGTEINCKCFSRSVIAGFV